MGDSFMETKRETLFGRIYESGNGQLVIDTHATDEEHLLSPATRPEQPLYDCRHYLRDLVPKEWQNRTGRFLIDRTVTRAGEVVGVAISFIPTVGIDKL